jgi:hypothetical protein
MPVAVCLRILSQTEQTRRRQASPINGASGNELNVIARSDCVLTVSTVSLQVISNPAIGSDGVF